MTKSRLLSALLTSMLLLSGCSTSPSHPAASPDTSSSTFNTETSPRTYETDELDLPRTKVTLVKAIDGDTISVKWQGNTENVRFLLIDTPETKHPRLGVQPFGPEAKAFTAKVVEEAKTLELEFDIGPNRDKYGRLLAYVYADGIMVQEELLKEGLARVAYIYPPNVRYVDKFNDLQQDSRSQQAGIWSVENYAQEDGFHPDQTNEEHPSEAPAASNGSPDRQNNSPPKGCSIKGNINAKGEKIYHTPASPYYERTVPEEWFCNEQEAVKSGFRAPKR
ncbi:thermonuclease family protein [Paenibacillus lemnae]|uniref:Nuclease n=1 Tax=Paenibacillus lemnae TaxID=1330551 RepID=A0A848M6H6_PAELE|nr:thermonuclease family protein [Paenibacillus lemnae]NMO95790.1 nuclease [Paenibacillus lemnae]